MHNSEVTQRNGTAVVIIYEVCKGCNDQLSRNGTSQFCTMGRINVELEALAARIVEQEVQR